MPTYNTRIDDPTTRKKLQALAADLGIIADRGPYVSEGSIKRMLRAIADGELVVVKREEYERMAQPQEAQG